MVVRKDMNLETLGVMAELPPDLSPLQLGTRGEWNGKGFELLGRLRVEWDEGSWNEWYAHFSDGSCGWVAESQGFYMVSFEDKNARIPSSATSLGAGEYLDLGRDRWNVVDNKSVRCRAGEGELPFAAPPGSERQSVDFTSIDGSFASLEYSDNETSFYDGSYAKFKDLHFTNLRPVPGWSTDAPQIRHQTNALNCPNCGAVVNLRAQGQTMSAVCGSCGSIIDTSNPVWTLVQTSEQKVADLYPLLEIGSRGKLQDVDYEVIGFVKRSDSESTWHEYLLFNPWHGFEWLVCYSGHWSFVHRHPEISDRSGAAVEIKGRKYVRYAEYTAVVTGVLGEFYWKVKRGEEAMTTDYINPPRVLSKEYYRELNEFTWSLGKYVDSKETAAAFGKKALPPPTGPYLNEPNPYAERWRGVKTVALLFLVIFTVIQLVSSAFSRHHPLYKTDLVYSKDDPVKIISSPKFKIEGGPQLVDIRGTSNLSNSWLSIGVELVNAQTNEAIPDSIELEYYSGSDEDGRWSEVSNNVVVSIPGVKTGEYYLNIEPSADPALRMQAYRIEVTSGGVFWSNYFFGLFVVMIYPIYLLFRAGAFESRRWAESDFSMTGVRSS